MQNGIIAVAVSVPPCLCLAHDASQRWCRAGSVSGRHQRRTHAIRYPAPTMHTMIM